MHIKYSDRCRACTVKSVFIRAHLAEIPEHKAFRKMRINKKKKRDKEVRAACCQQRAPDVKDIQMGA